LPFIVNNCADDKNSVAGIGILVIGDRQGVLGRWPTWHFS